MAPTAFSGRLAAQFDANLGRIVGRVSGPDGSVIPDAAVVVTALGSGFERTVHSDASGWFQAGSLDPGEYSVTAASPDFAPGTADGITVSVGSAVQVDLELSLEATYITLDVSASMLDAMLPASSNVVPSQTFNELPINGRRFHDFALLTPTVQVSPASGQLSFAAMRGIYTNVMVDGSDYNQSFFGGIQGGERASQVITVPQSAVQEFQAITSGFTAEYGRTISGVVNVSTKSGGSELHGDAFYQIRDPRLGRADPFGAKVLQKQQQFGGSLGGPIRADRAFWFLAIERQASVSPHYVEFPLLASANRARGPEAYDYYKSLETPFDATNDALALTPRLDYHFSGGGKFMARYNFSNADPTNAVAAAGPNQARTSTALSSNGTEQDSIHFFTSQLTSLLSAGVVNQLRFTVTREERPRIPNTEGPLVSTLIGEFGSSFILPTVESDLRPKLSNSLMVHHGAHGIKLGGEIDRIWVDDQFGYAQFGFFKPFSSDPNEILDILSPGGAIANRFDAPGVFLRQVGNTLGQQRLGHAAIYFQDSWRAAPSLTLDLGFRWAGQFNQTPEVGNDVLIERVTRARFPFGTVSPGSLPDDLGQWMPRLGFAYSRQDLSRNFVIRGSVGIFHAITPPVFFNAATKAFREPAFNLQVALPTKQPTVYQQFLAAGIDLNGHALAELPVFSREEITRVLDGDRYAGAAPYTVSPDFRNPRSVKYTLALEYELTDNSVAGLQWMRHRTGRLHSLRDYNLPLPVVRPGDPAQIPFYDTSNRPAPEVGMLNVIESIGQADYDGMTANWKYRGKRLRFTTHYTYARAFSSDVNDSFFWEPRYTDNARPEDAYGPGSLDIRHQLTGNAIVALPLGLSWAAIVRASSAPPLNPVAGTDLNGDRLANERALESPGKYFGRNSFRNRSMGNVDMRILREFRISERSRMELSLELFNAFDVANVEYGRFNSIYGPGLELSTGAVIGPLASFQRLRAAGGGYDRNNQQSYGTGPLQAQIGLRYHF